MDTLERRLPLIKKFLSESAEIYRLIDLQKLLAHKRQEWKLPKSLSSKEFVKRLVDQQILGQTILTSDEYRGLTRYLSDGVSDLAVALSLKEGSYLTHASAIFLHGLNNQLPSTIYTNKEQSAKPSQDVSINQKLLDDNFSNKQRESKYIYRYRDSKIIILSGKNTGRLEVIGIKDQFDKLLPVTSIARTLVDIAVRPNYGGGVYQVLEAFKGARDHVSVSSILSVLKKLNYKYPYHQAIGFYMSQAGFPTAQTDKVRKLGLNFDFYLDYGIPKTNREYVKEWRLFVPKGF